MYGAPRTLSKSLLLGFATTQWRVWLYNSKIIKNNARKYQLRENEGGKDTRDAVTLRAHCGSRRCTPPPPCETSATRAGAMQKKKNYINNPCDDRNKKKRYSESGRGDDKTKTKNKKKIETIQNKS